jgi:hypothetical protein
MDYDVLIQEELDGALTPVRQAMLDEHCAECLDCATARAGYANLRRATGLLPETVPPGRDLWAGIADRLDTPAAPQVVPMQRPVRTGIAWGRYLLAAGLALGALGLALLQLQPDTVITKVTVEQGTPEDPVAAMEREYKRARAELLAAIQGPEQGLSEDTLQTVTANLAVIDTAVAEIQDALISDPANPNLIGLLVATRDKEMEMLSAMARLGHAG